MTVDQILDTLIMGNYRTPADIQQIFMSFNKWFSVPNLILNENVVLYRARIIDDISEITTPEQLSYTPASYNKSYKRASTPNNTMFYAISGDSKLSSILGCFSEICDCFRKPNAEYKKYKIVVGLWETTTELTLPQIINIDGYNKSEAFQNAEEYTMLLRTYGPLGVNIANFWRFMNKEFTKVVTEEKEYWVSAVFTEWLVNRFNYPGVIYESVQSTDPKLMNNHCVALTPRIADQCLKFIEAQYFEFDYNGMEVQLNSPTILDLH